MRRCNDFAVRLITDTIKEIDSRLKQHKTYAHAKSLRVFEVESFRAQYGKTTRWSLFGSKEMEDLAVAMEGQEVGHNVKFDFQAIEEQRIGYFKEMHRFLEAKAYIVN